MATDFKEILEDLKEWGFNDYKMAELTGIDRSMLSRLRTGKRDQPTYDNGVAIIKIYTRELKKHGHT